MLNSGFSEAIGSCKIIAICAPRIWRISLWLRRARSLPAKSIWPPTIRAADGRRPTIDRQVVVLPQPLSPTMPSVSPSFSEKLTPSTALTMREPPKVT
jgi:hypothetical protein